jgi:hypothetical protein
VLGQHGDRFTQRVDHGRQFGGEFLEFADLGHESLPRMCHGSPQLPDVFGTLPGIGRGHARFGAFADAF